MKKKLRKGLLTAALLTAFLTLAACGGSDSKTAETAKAAETTRAPVAAKTVAATQAKPDETKETKEEKKSGDAGKYLIYEYESNGHKVDHGMLTEAGMGDTWLELYEDGTGKFNLFKSMLDITWKPGEITVYGTSKYTYELDGDTLNLDMQGVYYTMKRDGSAPVESAAGNTGSSSSKSGDASGTYYLSMLGDMSIREFAEMTGTTADKASEMIMIELSEDGSMDFIEDGEAEHGTYTIDDDVITLDASGEKMTGTIKGDSLTFDLEGEKMVLTKTKPSSGEGSETDRDAETKAEANAENAGASGGDGIVRSEEELQKDYVWMNKVAKDIFHTTYEDLVAQFGVEGKFDKEEYSEHMKVNKRYYFWISPEDENHFIYVNFEEDDPDNAPGVYTVSGFNSSGFSASEAESRYLEEVQAAANEADKVAAANMKMKDFSVDIHPFAHDEDTITVSMQIPESGWSYDENKDHLVENEDPNTFGAGFIQFKVDPELSKFDFYKDKFENYKDIDEREIGGIKFAGRTYKNIGYEWTEYIAQIDDSHAVSIGIVRIDTSEGSMGDRILGSIRFKS
ncbi:MAG: hypothetical protein J5943_01390 [Oribacterium sp.]|nr:hypothetical protein [Oribacterium sp.]MBO6308902.1 hypothetical protein [Oribacterium sp.]MBP3803694.1 hypothetical protein [Oribacterium sp.]